MTAFFLKQPNGLLARFHTGADEVTHWNLTRKEAISILLEEARADAEKRVQGAFDDAATRYTEDGESRWEACVELAKRAWPDDMVQVIAEASTPIPDTRPAWVQERDRSMARVSLNDRRGCEDVPPAPPPCTECGFQMLSNGWRLCPRCGKPIVPHNEPTERDTPMNHIPPDPNDTPENQLRVRLRQLVIDWRLADGGDKTDAALARETCADDLEHLLDEQ